ncbi:MAG TPA: 2OG-Fe(II) oxygenase [Dongiaceae bacterium]|nr:2OG-Fe(II) oxygenase [Dongiaceae bacterium]
MSMGEGKVEGPRVGNLGAQPGPKGAPGGTQGQQPHFIRMYRDTFSRELCEEVIRRFEADQRKHASTTATRDKPRLRSGTMLQIGDLPEWKDIADAYSVALEKNLQSYAQAFPTLQQLVSSPATKRTPPLLERIEPGQGFGMHIDASVAGTHDRMVAVLMYLKDVEQGGETQFPFQSIQVKPRAGMMLLFPPYWTHPHQGVSPVSGLKYNLTSYVVVDNDFRPAR